MKTTFDIPDELIIQAKKRAAEPRRPVRELVIEGLRAQLQSAPKQPAPSPVPIQWVTHPGGLPPHCDVADRAAMTEAIRRQS